MSSNSVCAVASATIVAVLVLAGTLRAQPAPMTERGCCCVAQGKSYACTEKTQADCLNEQPAAPTFAKTEDWKKAWNEWVRASETQEAKPLRGGWIAGRCEK
jgi:hypothetical protein